jgi:hypothetical protein
MHSLVDRQAGLESIWRAGPREALPAPAGFATTGKRSKPGLILLLIVYVPILGFGDARYLGPQIVASTVARWSTQFRWYG